MDLKNTAILLMFFLCVLGLIVGVYYSEGFEDSSSFGDDEKVISEDSENTIIIHIENLKSSDATEFLT